MNPTASPASTPRSCTSSAAPRTCTSPRRRSSRAPRPTTTSSATTSPRGCTSCPASARSCASCPFGQGRPNGSTTPTSTSTTTCATPRCPRPAREEQLRTLAARIFSQRLDRSKPRLGDVAGRRARGRTASRSSPRATTAWSTASPGLTSRRSSSTPTPSRRPPRARAVGPAARAQRRRSCSARRWSSARPRPAEMVRGARAVFRAPAPGRPRAAVDALEAAGAFARSGARRPRLALQRRDRALPALRLGPARDLGAASRRSRTSWAGRSTTSSSPSSPARSAATCARAATRPRSSSCGRWCRSASARATSTARSATGSPRSWRRCPVWCEDPLERLRLVSAAMGDLKESKQAVGATLMTELSDFAPPTIAGQAARLQPRQRFFNLVVTNVPGPAVPALPAGPPARARSSRWCRWPRSQAVCFGIMSYDGQVNFGLIGDYEAMARPRLARRRPRGLDRRAADAVAPTAEVAGAGASGPPRRKANGSGESEAAASKTGA